MSGEFLLAGGVLLALFATGWLLGTMIAPESGTVTAAANGGRAAAQNARRLIRLASAVGTAGLLPGMLLVAEAASGRSVSRADEEPPPNAARGSHE